MTAPVATNRSVHRETDLAREGDHAPRKTTVSPENLDDFLANGHVEPIHPGPLFRQLVIEGTGAEGTGYTVRGIAEKSGISREMLHRILRGNASITAKTAIGLAEASGTDAEFWMRAQTIFDLWTERKKRQHAAAS